MRGSTLVVIGTISVTALSACALTHPNHGSAAGDDERVVQEGNAMVLTAALLHQDGRPLLDVLRQRLTNLQIDATESCPDVYMRGRSSIANASNATIYVDGQRAANSCILNDLFAFNLERVEVYPMGVTQRPGYFSDPDGLILIFLRRANQ